MSDRNCEVNFLDRHRSAPLWDVGAPGYLAAVGVDPDGRDVLVLASEEHLNVEGAPQGCADQPHERIGPLPAVWRRRINGDPRCGAPTAKGRPCRVKVASQGDICGIHRRPRCSGCGQIMLHQAGGWGCFGCHPDRHWIAQQQQRRGAP